MKLYSKKEIGKALKRERKKTGITQELLSESLHVHIKTVMNWEQGVTEPPLETLYKLCELYNCDIDHLLGRIEETTHDLVFIKKETGLSEKSIKKIISLSDSQTATLSKIIEHNNLDVIIRAIEDLSDHESLNQNLASIIIDNISKTLDSLGGKTVPKPIHVHSSLLEDAMIYKINTAFTEVVRDITDTPVSE